MRGTVLMFTIVLLGNTVFAQYNCNNYHKFNCPRSADKEFTLNGQSKSAMVQIGEPTELNVIVYRGQDYRISFCTESSILGEYVEFQILQKERVPVEKEIIDTTFEEILDENGEPTGELREVKNTISRSTFEDHMKVLYDNSKDDMSQEVEFSITSTKRLIVRILAHGPDEDSPKRRHVEMDIGCVGVLLEHMPTPELGF